MTYPESNRDADRTYDQSASGGLEAGELGAFSLIGKVAIVTGGSSGLGPQIGESLRQAGAMVVLAARRREPLELTASRLDCAFQVVDVTSEDDRVQMIERTIETFGSIDILVNNAGIASTRPAEEESASRFRAVLETNLVAPFELARLAGIHMIERGGGSIINVASTLGMVGNRQIPDAAYAASKGGLVNLTRELAAQWARRGVRVNAIAPGYFETEMTSAMFDNERSLNWIARNDPMGRSGRRGELGGAVVFLASSAASYVTGHILVVDGGWIAV
jgi:NAD(P)-dependent dehydrogenase (short-subunit alcohol dehydrogenase family)